MSLSPPKAILLDLDNTAYAYDPCHEAGMRFSQIKAKPIHKAWGAPGEFSREYGQARDAVKRTTEGQGAEHCRLLYFKRMVEQRLGKTDFVSIWALHEAYWEGYFSAMKTDSGCAEFLQHVRAKGIRVSWVTNFTTERQMLKLRKLGLEGAADYLVTSEEAGADKPAEAPFLLALSALGVAPKDALTIGDSIEADILPARKLGTETIWLNRNSRSKPVGSVALDWSGIRTLVFG